MDSKTVREYFQILVDTLLGVFVEPFARRRSRAILTRIPKFYLFDVGLAGYVTRRRLEATTGPDFGRALEHFVLMELLAYRSYRERDFPIRFWRTKTGLECDFVLGPEGEVVVEVKAKSDVPTRGPVGVAGLRRGTPPAPRPSRLQRGCSPAHERWALDPAVAGVSGTTLVGRDPLIGPRCSSRTSQRDAFAPRARRPTWRNPHDPVGSFTPARMNKVVRDSRWPGPASSPQVSRSRRDAGRRPVARSPGGGPLSRAILSLEGYAPRREPSRRLGSAPPRPCGPLCRPEVGVPSRPPRSCSLGSARFAALRAAVPV